MFVSATREAIARLADAGLTARAIAVELGLAPPTVDYHLSRLRQPDREPNEAAGQRGVHRVLAVSRDLTLIDAERSVRTRVQVAQMLDAGIARVEIARRLGISKATVSYHARRLGAPIDTSCARRYDWAEVQRYYDAGHSVRECIAEFGFSSATWFEAVKRGAVVARPAWTPISELFVAGTYRGRYNLKNRLLRAGLKDGSCELCGLTEWRGEPITLALHHVNGVRNDNRIDNLQLLCPNCHSQTDSYAGRNGGRRGVI
jgi:DNA-binding CsgD family transcriptional regulator